MRRGGRKMMKENSRTIAIDVIISEFPIANVLMVFFRPIIL